MMIAWVAAIATTGLRDGELQKIVRPSELMKNLRTNDYDSARQMPRVFFCYKSIKCSF
jgi:hypothetical protein